MGKKPGKVMTGKGKKRKKRKLANPKLLEKTERALKGSGEQETKNMLIS